jgi:AcrR family transcriptional regulator
LNQVSSTSFEGDFLLSKRGVKTTAANSKTSLHKAERVPQTERGRRTRRALLNAAAAEFGEKGFHESSVVSITTRAGVALGSFYTYFESKDLLFRALVRDLSEQVKNEVAPVVEANGLGSLASERPALEAFLSFVRKNKQLYRIIDEAEFVANDEWRAHYFAGAARILQRLQLAEASGDVSVPIDEVHAWAIMGMNVFIGLRYGVLETDRTIEDVAAIVNAMLQHGLYR